MASASIDALAKGNGLATVHESTIDRFARLAALLDSCVGLREFAHA